jgi:hypothetical protein
LRFQLEIPVEELRFKAYDFELVDYFENELKYELRKIAHDENDDVEYFTMLNRRAYSFPPIFTFKRIYEDVGRGLNMECYLLSEIEDTRVRKL